MWMKVISLRSKKARIVYVVMVLAVSLVLGHRSFVKAVERPVVPGAIYQVQTSQKAMALTINVVWGTQYVPVLLQALENAHAKATFMVGGGWAKAHPTLVKDMVKAGMEVGNHGYAHRHVNQLSLQENIHEIQKTNDVIKSITGQSAAVFSPPYGEYNATVLRASASLRMPLVMWSIDTIDWRPSSSVPYMVEKVSTRARPGALVLMHPTDRTALALPQILTQLRQKGYHLVTVSKLLTMGTPQGEN